MTTTRYHCHITSCHWFHDGPNYAEMNFDTVHIPSAVDEAKAIDAVIREHFETHSLEEWVREIVSLKGRLAERVNSTSTTTTQVREAFATISNVLGAGITAAQTVPDAAAALVAHIDQVRAYADAFARTLDLQPSPAAEAPTLRCASCIQEARNDEAEGKTAKPILPATTVVQGLALCDVEGRHRIVTAVQAAAANASRLLLPGQGGQMPPGMGN